MSCGAVQDASTHYGIPYALVHSQADGYWSADAAGRWCTVYTLSGDRVDAGAAGYNGNYILLDESNPTNTILLTAVPPPPTCLTPDTLILMADGSETRIADIRSGDEVLGPDGLAHRVTDIERPILGSRLLYAINDDNYFITAEHPVMTESGWKAVDPAATAAENASLLVGQLHEGDTLRTLSAEDLVVAAGRHTSSLLLAPRLATVPLTRLRSKNADPAMLLYNLLLEGGHAYFANRVLVHNKNGH